LIGSFHARLWTARAGKSFNAALYMCPNFKKAGRRWLDAAAQAGKKVIL
jgi:hypothetical protein